MTFWKSVLCCSLLFLFLGTVLTQDADDCAPDNALKIRKHYFDSDTYEALKHITTAQQFEEWWKGERGEEGEGEEGRAPKSAVYGFYGSIECEQALKRDIGFQCAQLHTGPDYVDALLVSVDALPSSMLPPDSTCGVGFIGGGCSFSDADCIKFSPHDVNDELASRHSMSWIAPLGKSSLELKNERDETVHLFWMIEGAEPRHSGTLAPGEKTTFQTYMSHAFYARKTDSPDSEIVDFVVSSQPKGQLWVITQDDPTKEDVKQFEDKIFNNWIGAREARNYLQSRLIRPVTEDGFRKIKLPERLYEDILQWYNKLQPQETVETPVGPCLNQEVADTYMVHLSQTLQDRITKELQPILEEWSNEKLEKTALYGIRRYTEGSVLEMHTDTAHTHAVSAIINVKQEEIEKDWPLEIYDHNNVLHEVVMEPGDMVLYESAKLIHGRTQRLQGQGYSNFFLHYRPTDLSRWDYLWM